MAQSRCSSPAPAVEKPEVGKSLYAIGAMGVASCILLSFMMQHLLKVRKDHVRSPLAAEVEERLGRRVCGPVTTETNLIASKVVTTLHVKVLADLHKRQLVDGIAPFLWQRLAIEPSQPEVLRFVVSDDAGIAEETIDLVRPRVMMPIGKRVAPTEPPAAPPAKPEGH